MSNTLNLQPGLISSSTVFVCVFEISIFNRKMSLLKLRFLILKAIRKQCFI